MHAQLVIPQPGKENRKTGPIPTAYVARESCPSSCPLLGNGCYAETDNIGLHWRKMKGVPWAKFCLMVAESSVHGSFGASLSPATWLACRRKGHRGPRRATGEPWTFPDHRTMASVIAEEEAAQHFRPADLRIDGA